MKDKQNGITLIALIVTIIVLLILAGVAISTLAGENSVINRAVNTKIKSEQAEVEEELRLAVIAAKTNENVELTETSLKDELKNAFGEEGTGYKIEGNSTDGWTVTIPEKQVSYFVNSDGGIQNVEYEEPIDNSGSLVEGFVDDLGTRATIYLYANPETCSAGETITITDNNGATLKNVDGASQATVQAVAKNADGKLEITGTSYADGKNYYLAYPVTKNGTYTFKATKTGVTEPTTTTIKVKNIETFTAIEDVKVNGASLSYYNSENKAYNYKGAAVPKGYYVDTNSEVDTGLVITDSIDSNGYSTGNEWVWVPVVEDESYKYHLTVNSEEEMYGATSVKYTNYSKLWKFTTDKSKTKNKTTIENLESTQAKPNSNSGHREPALLGWSDAYDYSNYTNVYSRKNSTSSSKVNFTSTDGLDGFATQLRDDYDNMVKSVNAYKGFYIGRYEITANGEKAGESLTNKTWYELYNECMYLNNGTNTETSMIYGTLWDATMKWLADNNYNVGDSGEATSGYGNYGSEAVIVQNSDKSTTITVKAAGTSIKLSTGQTSYTKSNNIYDLSGNCYDWTQEATNNNYHRVLRGGYYSVLNSSDTFSAYRYGYFPTISKDYYSSRPQLYIK